MKFHLDLFNGLAFNDDRQVVCLTAQLHKPTAFAVRFEPPPEGVESLQKFFLARGKSAFEIANASHLGRTANFANLFERRGEGRRQEERVVFTIERLSDYLGKFDVWHLLERDFGWKHPDDTPYDYWGKARHVAALKAIAEYAASAKANRDDKPPDLNRLMYRQELQKHLLALYKLTPYHRPIGLRGSPVRPFLTKLARGVKAFEPFRISLATLPNQGKGDAYSDQIKLGLERLKRSVPGELPFVIPLELDIGVSPDLAGGLRKDLDNILIDIAGQIDESLVDPNHGYLAGYRAYLDETLGAPNTVELRLLAPGAISHLHTRS